MQNVICNIKEIKSGVYLTHLADRSAVRSTSEVLVSSAGALVPTLSDPALNFPKLP